MSYERQAHPSEDLRLEAVVVSVGFDDILRETIHENLPHLDTLIVVTTPDDAKTRTLCKQLCVTCVPTDLIVKDGGPFNRGAAVNAGFDHFRFMGWRLHLDSDIILPRDFRRTLFNNVPLDKSCLYSVDRVNVYGFTELQILRERGMERTPHVGMEWASLSCTFVESKLDRRIGARTIDSIRGWVPSGYFQLWHASQQKPYPNSLGNCSHDDESFSGMWPRSRRVLLPEFLVYHLCSTTPMSRENSGGRTTQRLDGKVSDR